MIFVWFIAAVSIFELNFYSSLTSDGRTRLEGKGKGRRKGNGDGGFPQPARRVLVHVIELDVHDGKEPNHSQPQQEQHDDGIMHLDAQQDVEPIAQEQPKEFGLFLVGVDDLTLIVRLVVGHVAKNHARQEYLRSAGGHLGLFPAPPASFAAAKMEIHAARAPAAGRAAMMLPLVGSAPTAAHSSVSPSSFERMRARLVHSVVERLAWLLLPMSQGVVVRRARFRRIVIELHFHDCLLLPYVNYEK